MKKWVLVLAFCATAMQLDGHAAGGSIGPRIEVKTSKYDLGKVKAGHEAVHTFEFRNAGDEVLEINNIRPS